ncbi:CAZyme family AA11 [Aspergillus niger]|nr:CAZyme family AA11 [Aspergillus niger]KAI3037376.1 CAZyme family AA11 [Aspergillus niger]
MRKLWMVYSSFITYTAAHIQMSDPLPIRSPLNTNSSIKDYSYTSPLSATGSDFPCKGYAGDPFDSVAEYTAGQEYAITLAGTATHGGGSCQISLSYDMGETFRVIHSILGHCPEPLHYSFRIPEDAPHGPALLAWTWFNKIGNREMYMNCAQVTIQPPISDVGALQGEMQQASWLERPPIFLANINGEGQCVTIEGEEQLGCLSKLGCQLAFCDGVFYPPASPKYDEARDHTTRTKHIENAIGTLHGH